MPDRRAFLAATLMISASVAAAVRRPRRPLDANSPELARDIPERFGPWRTDTAMPAVLPSPDVQAKLDRVYSQLLARTYIDDASRRIMLMMAYSADQAELTTQAHMPDVCYPAQGFTVVSRNEERLALGERAVPAVRMLARAPGRIEPVTYWVVMGGSILQNERQRRFANARYTLQGVIPDGMLVRVSSIDADERRAYTVHDEFLRGLLGALSASTMASVFGTDARAA